MKKNGHILQGILKAYPSRYVLSLTLSTRLQYAYNGVVLSHICIHSAIFHRHAGSVGIPYPWIFLLVSTERHIRVAKLGDRISCCVVVRAHVQELLGCSATPGVALALVLGASRWYTCRIRHILNTPLQDNWTSY